MDFFETPIDGLLVITPKIFKDSRGYFYENYNKKAFEKAGIITDFVQDNQSLSSYGTIRGIHYQRPPYTQAKLLRVIRGKVWDVAVDLRKKSRTFGQWYGVELSEENAKQFFVPRGFAHGFSVLSETAVFAYKCDNFYNKESESGILYADRELKIDWKIDLEKATLSDKDNRLQTFKEYRENQCF